MNIFRRIVSLILSLLLVLGPGFYNIGPRIASAQPVNINPPRTAVPMEDLVNELLAETDDPNDQDSDGLPDSVEAILGTDPENADSDFDRIDDYTEFTNGLNPLDPDSNTDGLPDYLEINNVAVDFDNDGLDNAWDFDNDGDGVNDGVDLSPFAVTDVTQNLELSINSQGGPLSINIQLKPKNQEYLLLFGKSWDWPDGDKEGSFKDYDNSKEDVSIFPMLEMTVNEPPSQEEVEKYSIGVDGNTVLIPLYPVYDHGTVVAFAGRLLYPTSSPSNLTIDAKMIWKVVGKNDPDEQTLNQDTLLATYYDEFSITGLNAKESSGTEVGLFYSNELNQAVAANLQLAYDFIRISGNHIADMPAMLANNGISVSNVQQSYAHLDEALLAVANDLTPQVLDSLESDRKLPVITLLEERSSSMEMTSFQTVPSTGISYNIDLASEPDVTMKTMKTPWHETTGYDGLSTKDILAEVHGLTTDSDATYNLMSLMLFWNTGEQTLEGAGLPVTDPPADYQLVSDLTQDIAGGTMVGLELLYQAGAGLNKLLSYNTIEFLQTKGWPASLGSQPFPEIAKFGDCPEFKSWIQQCKRVQDSLDYYKKLEKCLEVLDAVALFVDAGFAAATVVSLAQNNNLNGLALHNALMDTMMDYYYACALFMIGAIPYVGWLVAIAIEISDMFGNWSDDMIDFFIGWTAGVDYRVTPKIEIIGDPVLTFTDLDGNGMDVGDRIEYSSRLKGTVSDGRWDITSSSYIRPYYWLYGPGGSNSPVTYYYWNEFVTGEGNKFLPMPYYDDPEWIDTEDSTAVWKADEYPAGGWIEPGAAMPNFPVHLRTDAFFSLGYRWSHYVASLFKWGWCYHNSYNRGITQAGATTLYFDIMPATLDDFVQWRSIPTLDSDGDGIKDVDETMSNPWMIDTDGDGLMDKFEVDNGIDPLNYDTDGDGLIDWFEVQYGTDVHNPDTDGDGLDDFIEISGWLISFKYGPNEHEFKMRVNADPLIPDADGDGLDDSMEYQSGLNPRSADTDGDGTPDVGDPKIPVTHIEYDKIITGTIPLQNPEAFSFPYPYYDLEIDKNRNFYVPTVTGNSIGSDYVSKYAPDGTPQSSWLSNPDDFIFPSVVAVDWPNDRLYFFDLELQHIFVYNTDGTYQTKWPISYNDNEGHPIGHPMSLTFDSDGHLNMLRLNYNSWSPHTATIEKYETGGTLLSSWGDNMLGTGPGQFSLPIDMAIDMVNDYYYIANGPGETGNASGHVSKFEADGTYIRDIDGTEPAEFPKVATDKDGFFYLITDTAIDKYDHNSVLVTSWKDADDPNIQLDTPHAAVVDGLYNIFVLDYGDTNPGHDWPYGRILKFTQTMETEPVVDDNPDRDGDGLLNDVETTGWNISFTTASGPVSLNVTSDPLLADTDLDGLNDLEENTRGTNPRNPDTDNDGLTDIGDVNPLSFDNDQDGLSDGVESAFGSNPASGDSDQDGVPDTEEFALKSNPNSSDTDKDGLDDLTEYYLMADLTSPDTDGDQVFDGEEFNQGTDPVDDDTDGDGLNDGLEKIHGTNPLNSDTDNDNIPDGEEVEKKLDPLSNDTDGDGIPDGTELNQGSDPLKQDSDLDGINDNDDSDSAMQHVDSLVLAYDPGEKASGFLTSLAEHTNVTAVTVNDLLASYKNAERIVLVGRPDSGEPVGSLISTLLADAGSVLTDMIGSDDSRFAVRYGVWQSKQTVIMLSEPYPSDDLRVLEMLREKTVTIASDLVKVEYNKSLAAGAEEAVQSSFMIFDIDTVKQTDAIMMATLVDDLKPVVDLKRYSSFTTPYELNQAGGLDPNETAMGKYVEIILSDSGGSNDVAVEGAEIRVYYTASDLDINGDQVVDIDESQISIYYFNELTGQWEKLVPGLNGIFNAGVETTDVELYGNNYAGFAWASVSHLSLYGLSGRSFAEPPDISGAYPSKSCLWPPDNKFQAITIEGVTSQYGYVEIIITGLSSDEPLSKKGKEYLLDAYGVGTDTVHLRAERNGQGNGRIYEITFIAEDSAGMSSEGSVQVCVPHDMSMGAACTCIDDGQVYTLGTQ